MDNQYLEVMNNFVLSCIVILFLSGSCAQEQLSVEGAWRWVKADYSLDLETSPVDNEGSITKFWTKGHFSFIGQLKSDNFAEDRFGWGTYELDGNRYIEHIEFHYQDAYQGQSVRMILEIRNDTLVQKWPVDGNWALPEKYNTEYYIRRE
jgi:hypothetical protein